MSLRQHSWYLCRVGWHSITFAKTCERGEPHVPKMICSPLLIYCFYSHRFGYLSDAFNARLTQCTNVWRCRSYWLYPIGLSSLSPKRHPEKSHRARKIHVVFLGPPWGGPSYPARSDDNISGLTRSTSQMWPKPPSSSKTSNLLSIIHFTYSWLRFFFWSYASDYTEYRVLPSAKHPIKCQWRQYPIA